MLDKDLISRFLTDDEYDNAKKVLGRDLSLLEIALFAAMWSEHCSYKSSRLHLSKFHTKGKFVIQGPGENGGVVDIGDNLAAVFKMESHNHPSYIEPHQGAATGVGGILRDIFTMGARPVASLNSLKFGSLSIPRTKYLINGVISGIADYGNAVGVPTLGGEISFDDSYNKNCLVNVFSIGVAKKEKIFLGRAEGIGNPLIYAGSATGKDGIDGARMASANFSDSKELSRPTVQVGDPFTEKLLIEGCLELFKTGIVVGIQDMGAAGLTSSSFEMASRAKTGLKIFIDRVPKREKDISPMEIMLSESQERMLIVVEKGKEAEALSIFRKWDLFAEVIGEVTDDGNVTLVNEGKVLTSIPAVALAENAPIYDRKAEESDKMKKLRADFDPESVQAPDDMKNLLIRILSSPRICSKEPIWSQFDHMVRTDTVILPGSDASMIRIKGSNRGISISTDSNSRYSLLDPYEAGKQIVAESNRNVACSGATPIAITNCLNFGSPENPDVMFDFIKSIEGMSEAAKVLETPVVSGNVSFYNQTDDQYIKPTPVVGSVGVIEDISLRQDIYFKKPDDLIVIIGKTLKELGGSEYFYYIHDIVRGIPPKVDLERERQTLLLIDEIVKKKVASSLHDISKGGIAVALAESLFNHYSEAKLGCDLQFTTDMRADLFLFSETQSRILLSCNRSDINEIEQIAKARGLYVETIGKVTDGKINLSVNGKLLIDSDHDELREPWETAFSKFF